MRSADLALFHVLRLRRLATGPALDDALATAAARGASLETVLRERSTVALAALDEALTVRARQGRRCSGCGTTTYLAPGQTIGTTPCESCGGVLARGQAAAAEPCPRRASSPLRPLRRVRETRTHERKPRRTHAPPRRVLVASVGVAAAVLVAFLSTSERAAPVEPLDPAAASSIACRVQLPSGATFGAADLEVFIDSIVPAGPVGPDGRFDLPAPPGPVALVSVRVIGSDIDYLRALVLRGDRAVEVSSRSTAVTLVLSSALEEPSGPLAAQHAVTVARGDPSVAELGALLDSTLSADPACLDPSSRLFPGLAHKVLHARLAVHRAIESPALTTR